MQQRFSVVDIQCSRDSMQQGFQVVESLCGRYSISAEYYHSQECNVYKNVTSTRRQRQQECRNRKDSMLMTTYKWLKATRGLKGRKKAQGLSWGKRVKVQKLISRQTCSFSFNKNLRLLSYLFQGCFKSFKSSWLFAPHLCYIPK